MFQVATSKKRKQKSKKKTKKVKKVKGVNKVGFRVVVDLLAKKKREPGTTRGGFYCLKDQHITDPRRVKQK